MQKVETKALEITIGGRFFTKEDKLRVFEFIEESMPEELETLPERAIIFLKLLLLKFCEQTLESVNEGEVDTRDTAIEILSKIFYQADGEDSLRAHFKLNKSEIHTLDLPGYISKHKMVKEKKYIAYELVANILLVNEELDLVDIIGNDQRLRDGITKKQLE